MLSPGLEEVLGCVDARGHPPAEQNRPRCRLEAATVQALGLRAALGRF